MKTATLSGARKTTLAPMNSSAMSSSKNEVIPRSKRPGILARNAEGWAGQTEVNKAKTVGLQGSIWRAKEELDVRSIKEKVGWYWSLS